MSIDVLRLLRPNANSFQSLRSKRQGLIPTNSIEPEIAKNSQFSVGSEIRSLTEKFRECSDELTGYIDRVSDAHIRMLVDRLAVAPCRIAVVGQIKAGKSSFINALIQRPGLLPTHVNPWTTVATQLHFSGGAETRSGCEFIFFNQGEWEDDDEKSRESRLSHLSDEQDDEYRKILKEVRQRAQVRLGEKFYHLLGKSHQYDTVSPEILEHYLCAGPPIDVPSREIKAGRYADITKAAKIYLAGGPFTIPTVVIDTPGTNDPTFLKLRLNREIIEDADVYIVVLTARQPISASDIGLLRLLRGLHKSRILAFVNRIDELNNIKEDLPRVVGHVRTVLKNEFPGVAIPVICGSAKWAGLAGLQDIERLRHEVTLAPHLLPEDHDEPDGETEGKELASLRNTFRSLSGLDNICRELSHLMLSNFLATHALPLGKVMLSAADMAAATALRELHLISELAIIGAQAATPAQDASNKLAAVVDETHVLLKTIENALIALREEYNWTINACKERLCRELVADIEGFAEAQRLHFEEFRKTARASGKYTCDVNPLRQKLENSFIRIVNQTTKRMGEIENAVISFINKSASLIPSDKKSKLVELAPPQISPRISALSSEVSMDLEVSWLAAKLRDRRPSPQKADELVTLIRREFDDIATALVGSAIHSLDTFAKQSAQNIEMTVASSANQLARKLLNLKAKHAEAMKEVRSRSLQEPPADYESVVKTANKVIATSESVSQKIVGLFASYGNLSAGYQNKLC